MKLLVVTGIANSRCLPIYSALNSPMKKLADIIPEHAERLQKLVKQKNKITIQSLNEALGIQEDVSDYIFCDEKQVLNLSQWAAFSQLKIVVFYSNPASALANVLSQNELSLDECNEFMAEWAKQINDTFRFYQQHKDICLLLDSDDVNKHNKLASELISEFVEQEVSIGNVSNNPSIDTLLASNLILSEQDHLFEVYDEVRSSAPIFENFILSGTADYQSLAIDSLKSINTNRTAKVELNGKVSKLEQQNAALNEKVAQVTQQLSESQNAVDEANKKHQTEMAAAEQQKSALNEKVAQLIQQLSESQTAVGEANKKYQLELAALQDKVKQSDTQVLKLKKAHSDLESENELLVLQTAQLQEELEVTFEKNSTELRKVREALADREAELISSKTKWGEISQTHQAVVSAEKQTRDNLQSENTQLVAQVGKLQKELEAQKTEFAEFSSKTEAFNIKEQIDKINNERKNTDTDAVTKLTQLTEENELCVLQISQLQEELEALYQSKQELIQTHKHDINSQRNEQVQLIDKGSQTHQQIQSMLAENEIATLQINQLQEELEFYYQQLQEKEPNTLLTQLTNKQPCQNVFEQTTIESFDIIGSYEIPGYQDIQLLLNNVKIANGNYFEKLHVKLVEISGKPGIEFRPSEVNDDSVNLHWREDMQDEYGAFIRFIPNPSSEQQALQQKTNESLCASDRLIVLSIASKLADVLQMTTDSDLPEGKLRDWKLIAISLKHQVAQLPNWMSFDALSLVEEMRTDNYEHLWLRFNNLLVNDHLRPEFEVKFAVTDLTSDSDLFSTKLMLEIRQQDNQQSPLQAWPPLSQDDYGFKLQAFVNLNEDELMISVEEKLSTNDYQFLRHLVKNLVNFLQVFREQGGNLDRPITDWLAIGHRTAQIGPVKSEVAQDAKIAADPEYNITPTLDVSFNEHVDLGGYQHLLYQQALSDNEVLLIKVRAENINQDAKTAELFIELRTGDENIPLADSEFFGEDEFGPRVLMPIDFLHSDLFKQKIVSDDVRLIDLFNEQMMNLIDANTELDEGQKALWLAMLDNK